MERISLFLLVALQAVALTAPAAADVATDLEILDRELSRAPSERSEGLIDAKLAALADAAKELSPPQYRMVKDMQARRAVKAMAGASAPQKRERLNQARLAMIAEIDRLYLSDSCADPMARLEANKVRLGIADGISNSGVSHKAKLDTIQSVMNDLDNLVLKDPKIALRDKRAYLDDVMRMVATLRKSKERQQLELAVQDCLVTLGGPSAGRICLELAKMKLKAGELEGALDYYAKAVASDDVDRGTKLSIHCQRMRLLARRERWKEATADATVLSKLAIEDIPGSKITAVAVIEARAEALSVLAAAGELTDEAYHQQSAELCVDVLGSNKFAGEKKSELLTKLLIDCSRRAASYRNWPVALSWAKAAYTIAPNPSVPRTVELVQGILATRARPPLTAENFNLVTDEEHMAEAKAFYARQVGRKEAPVRPTEDESEEEYAELGLPKKAKTARNFIKLAADLSNDNEFPRQLDNVALPFAKLGDPLEKISVEHPDTLTRALACGLRGDQDKAIAVMADAINELGYGSEKLSGYVNFTARFVRAKFESVHLANAFLTSQVHGPAGKDGKMGTADDTPNPLMAAKP